MTQPGKTTSRVGLFLALVMLSEAQTAQAKSIAARTLEAPVRAATSAGSCAAAAKLLLASDSAGTIFSSSIPDVSSKAMDDPLYDEFACQMAVAALEMHFFWYLAARGEESAARATYWGCIDTANARGEEPDCQDEKDAWESAYWTMYYLEVTIFGMLFIVGLICAYDYGWI
jgi:hypothetical protein